MQQSIVQEADGLLREVTSNDSSASLSSIILMPLAQGTTSSISSQQQQNRNKISKKRRRIIIPAFSISETSASSHHGDVPSEKDAHFHSNTAGAAEWQHDDNERPDLSGFSQLLSALLLTTGLALLSALDAKEQCLQHETNALLDLVDDDNFQQAYEQASSGSTNCIAMFRNIASTGSITFGVGVFALTLLRCCNRKRYTSSLQSILRLTMTLLLLASGILAAQTYNIMAVMLMPRRDDVYATTVDAAADDDAMQNGAVDDEFSGANDYIVNNNPYQSLAAVDRYGHVGVNANLYYLSWLTQGLALALVYQLFTAAVRLIRATRVQENHAANGAAPLIHNETARQSTSQQDLLPTASWTDHYYTYSPQNAMRQRRRAHWFQNLYKLRARAGFWVAALFSCLVLVAASLATWNQVIWPYTKESPSSWQSTKYLHVCQHFADNVSAMQNDDADSATNKSYMASSTVPLCRRTVGAWLSGVIATALCATAIAMHLAARQSALTRHLSILHLGFSPTWASHANNTDGLVRDPTSSPSGIHHHGGSSWEQIMIQNKIPLQTELVLSFLLSCVLGFNAVFATGVQGPAATVGNLYYASWISFLLCLRICLGCLEEYHDIHDDEKVDELVDAKINAHGSRSNERGEDVTNELTAIEQQRQPSAGYQPPHMTATSADELQVTASCATAQTDQSVTDPHEKDRSKRLRGYFFLWVFSAVCACSAYDAAVNHQEKITTIQHYMIISPLVVTAVSACLFGLCLSKRCYQVLSSFWIGGILSIICFAFWFVDLVLTMHSDDSWAVNGIGEIEDANLYYYSWASIITAGIQMMYYIKAYFGIRYQDNMILVWMSICKVCFVILGASIHIWLTISANCEFDEIALGAVTYCSRTVLSMIVALTGMLVGGLVVFGRLCVYISCRYRCSRIQAHVEMLISMFLVLLFGAAVALITGIGGPGQTVGDLYYSTWIAFWVSLGIFVTCYNQLQEEEHGEEEKEQRHYEVFTSDK